MGEDKAGIVPTLGQAVSEVQGALGKDKYEEIRSEVDLILDRFFIKRIGLRFLLQHFIEAAERREGVSGIIHNDVHVGSVVRAAAAEAQELCQEMYGLTPEVRVNGDGEDSGVIFGVDNRNLSHDRRFTYVPIHLSISCAVLLQNACSAVAESASASQRTSSMPPIYATFAHGEDEVTVKVSDQGGGVPRSELAAAFSYFQPS